MVAAVLPVVWGWPVRRITRDGAPVLPAQPKRPPKARQARGETFDSVEERGETLLVCRSCHARVPAMQWWGHSCEVVSKG